MKGLQYTKYSAWSRPALRSGCFKKLGSVKKFRVRDTAIKHSNIVFFLLIIHKGKTQQGGYSANEYGTYLTIMNIKINNYIFEHIQNFLQFILHKWMNIWSVCFRTFAKSGTCWGDNFRILITRQDSLLHHMLHT